MKCIVNGIETELPVSHYREIPGHVRPIRVAVPAYPKPHRLDYNADLTVAIITDEPPHKDNRT